MIYLGKVVRVQGTKLYVTINELGGTKNQLGPLSCIVPSIKKLGLETEEISGHTHKFPDVITPPAKLVLNYYNKGDRVVVGQIGKIKEDLVVLGKLA
jgi:hypothetical protein